MPQAQRPEETLADIIKGISAQDDSFFAATVNKQDLLQQSAKDLQNIAADIERVRREGAVLFTPSTNGAEKDGATLAAAFDGWRANPPSIAALVFVAAEVFGIEKDGPGFKTAVMAGLAADTPHGDNTYHNTNHFREVTAAMIRLVAAGNALAAAGDTQAQLLEGNDVAKCIIAAASHDLLHDGKGNNPPGGAYKKYLLEDIAIAAAEPFAKLAGMAPADFEDIRVMIRVTDVSSDRALPMAERDPSPHTILRQIYAETHGQRDGVLKNFAVPPELAALTTNPKLLDMAAKMSDADLSPSAATTFEFSRQRTTEMSVEDPQMVKDNAMSLVMFGKFVMDGKFTSTTAETVGKKSLQSIFNKAAAKAEEEKLAVTNAPVAAAPTTTANANQKKPAAGAPKTA
ncbi:MAG: hypothetical protein PW788_12050 [Micavibrio sp.]|nr:hypothetical protein [Micavibrio sp.]